jgi:hypothetical protein
MSKEEATIPLADAEPEQEEQRDILHIGNLVEILSEQYGYVVGRIVYRDLNMVRIMPQETSDRAIEFPMTEDGSAFAPELGVSTLDILEEQPSDYYVDFLGAKPGEMLEFFTKDGEEAGPAGEVEEIIKTATKDSIRLKDGRVLRFRGRGPEPPIAVVRVRTAVNAAAAAAAAAEPAPEQAEAAAAAAATEARQTDLLALLRGVLPVATVEVVPTAEATYPDSMQREDMFQDLLSKVSAKQRTNPRRIRFVEREVDLAVALKNRSVLRDAAGRILGPAPYQIKTIAEAARQGRLPVAIPIVDAARVLNLDRVDESLDYKATDVFPRSLDETESQSETIAQQYLEGALPAGLTRGFFSYTYDLLARDQAVLKATDGGAGSGWTVDQDVIRTAGLGTAVQGLSAGLPKPGVEDQPPVSLVYLISDVTDRTVRVLAADTFTDLRAGTTSVIAPSDPFKIRGFVMIPPQAALKLRPPTRPGDLPMALLYSASLEDDNLPTIARTLADLYTPAEGITPLNAFTLAADAAESATVASWLNTVLRYTVTPVDSLGPRTPRLLALLDTLGLGEADLAPEVSAVIQRWVKKSQSLWSKLLAEQRAEIQKALDTEPPRTFQTVTGDDSIVWNTLRETAELKDLITDITLRNPTIAEAPTLLTASLLGEAQGDAMPLIWWTLAKKDDRALPLDPVSAAASLTASRSYLLRRRALRNADLLRLRAAPEVNTCPHVKRLEAVRGVPDVLQRSRLLRDFIEEYQGGRQGDWMTCAICKQDCVCYHELMELEALAQPARLDAIQKQILIRFGGERYEGKIICKNCGQGLQDIEYDEHVEFDDNGNPITSRSVLTAEQMEEPSETAWKKATAELAPPSLSFATQSQRELGEALTTMLERAGARADTDVVRTIVRYADLYVSLRAPKQEAYETQRAKLLTSATAKIRTATGASVGTVAVPTYAAVLDQLRVTALTALVGLYLQIAVPMIAVTNPFPLCAFSREGWPMDELAVGGDKPTALQYAACVVASIQKDAVPWRNVSWAGEPKFETRRKLVIKSAVGALELMINGDPKTGPLSFTPELRTAITKAKSDEEQLRQQVLVSVKDQIPTGFRPEPFPPTMKRPGIETDPLATVESAIASGAALEPQIQPIADALRQQAIAVVNELHEAATKAVRSMPQPPTKVTDSVCCSATLAEVQTGLLLGAPEQGQLVLARERLRDQLPTLARAGTHLWPEFTLPMPVPVEQTVEEGVFFSLFLKYCYTGPQVGELHEFSTGNICRQCGLRLGKPLEMIDFQAEGAGILAAQQGSLRVETTQTAFEKLSEAVRRRKLLMEPAAIAREPWRQGLDLIVEACRARADLVDQEGPRGCAAALEAVLSGLAGREAEPTDEIGRATYWAPLTEHMDGLRAEVVDRVGPTTPRTAGAAAAARAREAVSAMAMFDQITEDPFIEGPRALQEYWCAKTEAAGTKFGVSRVNGAKWFNISRLHNERLNKVLAENAEWFGGEIREEIRPVLAQIGHTLGPLLRAWVRAVRPAVDSAGPWTRTEAQMLLRCLVLQVWRDAVVPTSWMYRTFNTEAAKASAAAAVSDWTRALMFHVKQQWVKYSKEAVKRVLQQRAELERTSIVEEFQSIQDDDLRAAQILAKQFRIGRWSKGANIQNLDPDLFEFETEQRHRMGIVDPPVDPILLEGTAAAAAPAAQDFGFGPLTEGPLEAYEVNQGADGDDY